ncbi:MAG: C1 family peptidase, partial [Tetragenococcus koreensis]|nr:C1 family peptidase [Tetragenococcus koreensis]
MAEIKNELTAKFAADFKDNKKQQVVQNAVTKNGISNSAENLAAQSNNVPVFSIDLKTGNVANQKQSGRCWMFAALNTFRHKILDHFDLKDFELSQ